MRLWHGLSRALRSSTQLENLLSFRKQPIHRTNPILFGQALFKAINNLHRQKASCSANLDSPGLALHRRSAPCICRQSPGKHQRLSKRCSVIANGNVTAKVTDENLSPVSLRSARDCEDFRTKGTGSAVP
jgi:hypothetical protein